RLTQLGLPDLDWTDSAAIRAYAGLVEAAAAADALEAARGPLEDLRRLLADEARWVEAVPAVRSMLDAVCARDHERYAAAHSRLVRLVEVGRLLARRDELGTRLLAGAPRLHAAISEDPGRSDWPDVLAELTTAWAWAAAGAVVRNHETLDVNVVQAELSQI